MDTAAAETPKKPTHVAFVVRDGKENEKGRWIEIGAAWMHKDRNGFDVVLDAMPVGGRMVLRTPLPPKE